MLANAGSRARTGLAFLATSVVLVSVAQLVLKLAMAPDLLPGSCAVLLRWPWSVEVLRWIALLAVGAFCYGCSMLAWLGTLARLPVSVAYPTLSLSFLLVFAAAAWAPGLQESFDLERLLGIVLIVLGNATVAWSGIGHRES
ncbi:MAG: hypothetical protein R3E86_00270 [Pseudomonadales bacterium]